MSRARVLFRLTLTVVLVLAIAACRPAVRPAAEQSLFRLTIVHVNDTHGHLAATPLSLMLDGQKTYVTLGSYARLASKVEALRRSGPPVLLLHGGDAFQGTLFFTTYHGAADADLMNRLHFEAMAVGNHEFDQGPAILGKFLDAVRFPVLSANIDASASPELRGKIKPYVVLDIQGHKVGLIGLTTPETLLISQPGPDVRFPDPAASAAKAVKALEAQGVHRIVVLSHLGYREDLKLAAQVPGIDVIVGGHSHTLLGDMKHLGLASAGPYPTRVVGPDGAPVLVVQAWEWAKAAGVLTVGFNAKGLVVEFGGSPVLLLGNSFLRRDAKGAKQPVSPAERAAILEAVKANPVLEMVPEDPAVAARLKELEAGFAALSEKVVAQVAEDLRHARQPGQVHAADGAVLSRGSEVAPLVAASMLEAVQTPGLQAALAIENAGGVRTDLAQGPLTMAEVYELLPFGNTIVVLRLTGREIRRALETGVGRGEAAFPYLSGARYEADLSQPAGERIVSVEVGSSRDGWKPLDDEALYLVATNSYLAGGGDGYLVLKQAPGFRLDTGLYDVDVFIQYAAGKKTLRRPAETGVRLRPCAGCGR